MSAHIQCNFCKHFMGLGVCEAYLDGIPSEIIEGKHAQAIIKLFIDNSPKLTKAIAEGASKRELTKALRIYLNRIAEGASEGYADVLDDWIEFAKTVGSGGG